MNIKLNWIPLTGAILTGIVVVTSLYLFTPFDSSKTARHEKKIAEDVFESRMNEEKIDFYINITGVTLWDSIIKKMDLKKSPRFADESPGVIKTQEGTQRACEIKIDSRVIEKGTRLSDLKDRLANENIFWRTLLTHEIGHCIRNPLTVAIKNKIELSLKDRVVINRLNEAYADGFSVIYAYASTSSMNHGRHVSKVLQNWRAEPGLSEAWQTKSTINHIEKQIESKNIDFKSLKLDEMDKIVWFAAVDKVAKDYGFDSSVKTKRSSMFWYLVETSQPFKW